MKMDERKSTAKKYRGIKCRGLFVSLGALSFLHPFSRMFDWLFSDFDGLVGTLLYTGVMVSSVHALSDTRRHVIIAVSLVAPALVLIWIDGFVGLLSVKVGYLFFFLVFIGFTGVRVLSYVLKGPGAMSDKILGALSVYLLFGHGWAILFTILEGLQPGSFSGLGQTGFAQGIASELVYFSFVTLTTLGYGEITPVSITARNLAAMEAVTGVLYTATLVARLVGLYRRASGNGD